MRHDNPTGDAPSPEQRALVGWSRKRLGKCLALVSEGGGFFDSSPPFPAPDFTAKQFRLCLLSKSGLGN